jgi:hypothetical protein
MVPVVSANSPAAMSSSAVLPKPYGPTSASICPAGTCAAQSPNPQTQRPYRPRRPCGHGSTRWSGRPAPPAPGSAPPAVPCPAHPPFPDRPCMHPGRSATASPTARHRNRLVFLTGASEPLDVPVVPRGGRFGSAQATVLGSHTTNHASVTTNTAPSTTNRSAADQGADSPHYPPRHGRSAARRRITVSNTRPHHRGLEADASSGAASGATGADGVAAGGLARRRCGGGRLGP